MPSINEEALVELNINCSKLYNEWHPASAMVPRGDQPPSWPTGGTQPLTAHTSMNLC